MPTIRCSQCSSDNLLYGQFCSNCGTALTARCRVCSEDNLMNARFCRACGVELVNAPVGLFLDRAMAWREQFRKLGWLRLDEIDDNGWNLIKSHNFPRDDEDRFEPWVFACKTSSLETMRIRSVFSNSKDVTSIGAKGFLATNPAFIVATRCRLGIFVTKADVVAIHAYTDLRGAEGISNDVVQLNCANGDKIALKLNLPSAGTINVITAIAATDPVAKTWARRGMEIKAEQQQSFIELIAEFLYEIVVKARK